MAIGAMKNTSIVYQQGSKSGTGTGKSKVQTTKTEPVEVKKNQEMRLTAEPVNNIVTEVEFAGKQNLNSEQEKEELPKGNEAMRKAVEEINKNATDSEAIFGFHEETNRVTIKIVDKQSKEVLKEFPPEKTLDMIAKVWEMAGLMIDQKL